MREPNHAKKTEWLHGEAIMKEIYNGGMQAYIEKQVSHIEDALSFDGKKFVVMCVDERLLFGQEGLFNENECPVQTPGSFILCSKEEREKIFTDLPIYGFTSHEGCGACKVYAKQRGLDEEDTDAHGKEFGQKIVEELREKGRDVYYRHITGDEMHHPKEFHIARVVYYINTKTFNPFALSEDERGRLPIGFGISRAHFNEGIAQKDLKLCISIAFGAHGFGNLFTEEEPLLIVPVAVDEDSLENMKTEVNDVVKTFAVEDQKRVKIDGFYSV